MSADTKQNSKNKGLKCQVVLLDGAVHTYNLNRSCLGSELYTQIHTKLQLYESDYFGLEFIDEQNEKCWLDREKPILYQIGTKSGYLFTFKVKFYTPDPTLIEDELTRYLFALQIKQDLSTGLLTCAKSTSAMLAAYVVQSELGDFSDGYKDHHYLKGIKLLPIQTDDMEMNIMERHQTLVGLSVVDSEFQLLDLARKCDSFGVIPQLCMDPRENELYIAVTHSGVHVYTTHHMSRPPTKSFNWSKIRKLGFKRKKFLIKIHPLQSKQADKENTVYEYCLKNRDAAKSFWKLAVEHHSFFRRTDNLPKRTKPLILTRGSSFRYSGKTQKQLIDYVQTQKSKTSSFERSMSLRSFRSMTLRPPITRSITCDNSFEERSLTLGRTPYRVNQSDSRATLQSNDSGTYEPTNHRELPVSHILSALSPIPSLSTTFQSASTTPEPHSPNHKTSHEQLAAVAKQVDEILKETMVAASFEHHHVQSTDLSTRGLSLESSENEPVMFGVSRAGLNLYGKRNRSTNNNTHESECRTEIKKTSTKPDQTTSDCSNESQHADTPSDLPASQLESSHPEPSEVVVLSSPELGVELGEKFSESVVIELPPLRRVRSRSIQEEMNELESMSEVAQKIWQEDTDEGPPELKKITNKIVDLCSESGSDQRQLSDLSDLLAQYDSRRQLQKPPINRQNSTQNLATISDIAAGFFDLHEQQLNPSNDIFEENSKAHVRPPLPSLALTAKHKLVDRRLNRGLIDSGIEISHDGKSADCSGSDHSN